MSTISPRRRHPTNATNRPAPSTNGDQRRRDQARNSYTKRTKSLCTWAAGTTGCTPHRSRRLLARQRQVARLVSEQGGRPSDRS